MECDVNRKTPNIDLIVSERGVFCSFDRRGLRISSSLVINVVEKSAVSSEVHLSIGFCHVRDVPFALINPSSKFDFVVERAEQVEVAEGIH